MTGLTLRLLAAIAVGALILASLALISSQRASSVSGEPLIVYGSR